MTYITYTISQRSATLAPRALKTHAAMKDQSLGHRLSLCQLTGQLWALSAFPGAILAMFVESF